MNIMPPDSQVRRACNERRGLEDRAQGWKRIKRSSNSNRLDYSIVSEAWESDLLSVPDNQNKELVKVFFGPDPVTGEQQYDIHPRRAQLYTNKKSLEKFRCSMYATRLREAARATGFTKRDIILGKRQLVEARCPCIKRRKPSECDCLHHTFVEVNLHAWDAAREGARAAAREKGINPCPKPNSCPVHGPAQRAPLLAALAAEQEKTAWEVALAGAAEVVGMEERATVMEHATTWRQEMATTAMAMVDRAIAYDSMSKSEHHLRAALLPCGKHGFPDMNITGAPPFEMYSKACAFGNCPNKLWRGRNACGWEQRFGSGCPMDVGDQWITMQRWEQKLRGRKVDDEGNVKQSFSLELVPHTLTGREFYNELRANVTETYLPHDWRTTWTEQAHRVYEDKKSGAASDDAVATWDADVAAAAVAAKLAATAERLATLLSSVAPILARFAVNFGPMGTAVLSNGARVTTYCFRYLPGTFRALARVASSSAASYAIAAANSARSAKDSESMARTALEVYTTLARSVSVQSDYAAQVETQRSRTATCATRERHNLLVSVVGYKPYKVWIEKSRRWVYKQHVDVFYAFHKAGFKPSARSFNVVQEDIDHWLKYGTMRHGEWFMGGERLPGGDHRLPLPVGSKLRNASRRPPDFPEMIARKDKTDGCPNQFSYGTNYHQIAEWLSKTAEWHAPAVATATLEAKEAHAIARVAEEEADAALATAYLAAASADDAIVEDAIATAAVAVSASFKLSASSTMAAAIASDISSSTAGIMRSGNKLIEYEGKGSCDGYSNVPKHAIRHAIESGALIEPGTRELVLYLAEHKPEPSIPKAKKNGWEAVDRYFWGYVDTIRFTKALVPNADSWKGSKSFHEYTGRCVARQRAESEGPLQVCSLGMRTMCIRIDLRVYMSIAQVLKACLTWLVGSNTRS